MDYLSLFFFLFSTQKRMTWLSRFFVKDKKMRAECDLLVIKHDQHIIYMYIRSFYMYQRHVNFKFLKYQGFLKTGVGHAPSCRELLRCYDDQLQPYKSCPLLFFLSQVSVPSEIQKCLH